MILKENSYYAQNWLNLGIQGVFLLCTYWLNLMIFDDLFKSFPGDPLRFC